MFHAPKLPQRGACVDLPEEQKRWFFSTEGSTYLRAVKICETCSITRECLAWTLEQESPGQHRFGVAGGMTAEKRRAKFG